MWLLTSSSTASRVATVHTSRGANFPNGEVTVTVRAVHDGERVYFQFRWPDPERSQKHLPLVKEAAGWRVLQSEFDANDEDAFYEDKFAVALARKPALASGTVHLGQDLVRGPHAPITRGLHFTEDGSFRLEGLPPGVYSVHASLPDAMRGGPGGTRIEAGTEGAILTVK